MHIRIPSNAQTNPDPLASNNVSPNAFLSNGSLLSPSVSPHGSNDADHKDANLREVWQNTMCRNWKIPNGYQNVAVLLIRWDDSVDELNCADQVSLLLCRSNRRCLLLYHKVQELETTFKDKFNFTTDVLKLDGESKAQHQLRRGLSAFLGKYDDPSNLVVRTEKHIYQCLAKLFARSCTTLVIAFSMRDRNIWKLRRIVSVKILSLTISHEPLGTQRSSHCLKKLNAMFWAYLTALLRVTLSASFQTDQRRIIPGMLPENTLVA